MSKIVLIGYPATYKTTVGRLLAEKLNLRFVDTDQMIEGACGMSVAEIFLGGEAHFRRLERDALEQVACLEDVVVSTGGGAVVADNFPVVAKGATVVWLTAEISTVKSRLAEGSRPLFDGLDETALAQKLHARDGLYKQFATFSVATDSLTSLQTAEAVLQKLRNG